MKQRSSHQSGLRCHFAGLTPWASGSDQSNDSTSSFSFFSPITVVPLEGPTLFPWVSISSRCVASPRCCHLVDSSGSSFVRAFPAEELVPPKGTSSHSFISPSPPPSLPPLDSGTAEIFGCEHVPGKEYVFHDTKLAAFTWYGAVLETSESEGVSTEGGREGGREGWRSSKSCLYIHIILHSSLCVFFS